MHHSKRDILIKVATWVTAFIPILYTAVVSSAHIPRITLLPLTLWAVLVPIMGLSKSVGAGWELMLFGCMVAEWVSPVAVMWMFILLEGRDELLQRPRWRYLFWVLFGTSLAAAGINWVRHVAPFSELAIAFAWLIYSERIARGGVEREWQKQQAEYALAQRISSDIHDHLGNKLTVAAIKLRRVKSYRLSADVDKHVEDALMLVMAAIVDVQSVAAGLGSHQPWPQDIEATIELVKNQTGLIVDCSGPWNEVVDTSAQSLLVRTVREGLSNTMRHAKHATTCRVALTKASTSWNVAIEDDGESSRAVMPGFGLSALRESLESLGGHLVVESSVMGGVALRAQIPLIEGGGCG